MLFTKPSISRCLPSCVEMSILRKLWSAKSICSFVSTGLRVCASNKLYFKVSLALFQLVQRLLRRGRINALRDCLDKVVQLGFYARELCLYRSCRVIFPQLQFINAVGKLFNHFVA